MGNAATKMCTSVYAFGLGDDAQLPLGHEDVNMLVNRPGEAVVVVSSQEERLSS